MSNSEHDIGPMQSGDARVKLSTPAASSQHRLSAIARHANGTPLEYIDVSVEPEQEKTKGVEPAKKLLKEASSAEHVLYDVDAVPPWYLCILLGFQVLRSRSRCRILVLLAFTLAIDYRGYCSRLCTVCMYRVTENVGPN